MHNTKAIDKQESATLDMLISRSRQKSQVGSEELA